MTSVPSRPRLMRPLFSVRHSPRLTKMKGVPARIAPLSTASGTPHQPNGRASMSGYLSPKHGETTVERLGCEDHQEDDSLHDQDGGIGQIMRALDQTAARVNSAEQRCSRNHRQRILARDE